jgi:hypothetical protein
MDPKKAKAALKILLMGVSIITYGTMHKVERKLGEKIDEHYAEPEPEKNDNP